jgi:hypothetical protein
MGKKIIRDFEKIETDRTEIKYKDRKNYSIDNKFRIEIPLLGVNYNPCNINVGEFVYVYQHRNGRLELISQSHLKSLAEVRFRRKKGRSLRFAQRRFYPMFETSIAEDRGNNARVLIPKKYRKGISHRDKYEVWGNQKRLFLRKKIIPIDL